MILNFYDRVKFLQNAPSHINTSIDGNTGTFSGFCSILSHILYNKYVNIDKLINLDRYNEDILLDIFPELIDYKNNKVPNYTRTGVFFWYNRDEKGSLMRFNILYDLFIKIYSELPWYKNIWISHLYTRIQNMKDSI